MKPATKAAVETAVKEHLRVVVAAFKTEIKARKKDAANG